MSGTALTLIAYMAALLGIGAWASRRASNSEADFLLGGRQLGPIVSGLAYAASTSSAWVLLGFTGFVAAYGVSALWMVPGIWLGYVAVWYGLGPFLNRVSREEGRLTAIEVVAGDASPGWKWAITIAAAMMIVFCFAFYIAAQFQGAGSALSDVFHLTQTQAVIAGAIVILAYTLMGGFWAVSVTDTLQGLSIALIAIVLPFAALNEAGGFAGLAEGLARQAPEMQQPFGVYAGWSALGFVFGVAAIGLGAMGQPHLAAWLMAVQDRKARLQGAAVALTWAGLVYLGMSTIALSARAIAEPGAVLGETIVFDLAQQILPGILPGLVYAAILSAIMSTVDSQLLVASAATSHDLGLSKVARGREVLITRSVIAALCVAAVILTLSVPATIFGRVLFAWAALGAAFGPVLVVRAMGRNPTGAAVFAAMCVGFGLSVAFNQFLGAGVGSWRERILPWIAALIILFAFSAKNRGISRAKSAEIS